MGIRFLCPNGHKLNVKTFQAGRRGICPYCGAKFQIPTESTISSGKASRRAGSTSGAVAQPNRFEQELEEHAKSMDETVRPSPAWSGQQTGSTDPIDESTVEKPDSLTESDEDGSPDGGASSQSHSSTPSPTESTPEPRVPTAPDPLAESPSAVWYVRPPSGGQFGPAQSDMMRNWLAEGRVSAETLVWREGWPDWQEAGTVFPQLRPASRGPEAPPIASTGADTQTYRTSTRRRKNGSKIGLVIVLVVAVFLLIGVLVFALTRSNPSNQGNSVAHVPKLEQSNYPLALPRDSGCSVRILS